MDKNEAKYNIAKVADTLFGSLEKNLGNICEVEGPYYTIAGLGSGFDMGRKAIIAAIRSHDGRGENNRTRRTCFSFTRSERLALGGMLDPQQTVFQKRCFISDACC